MAQPILEEESPLEDYLRESELDLMPGTLPEFHIVSDSSELPPWVPSSVLELCHSLESIICPPANQPTGRQFAERFKYIIISSSLLSAFLSPSTVASSLSRELETLTPSDPNNVPITTSAFLLFIVAPISLASGHWLITIAALLIAKFYFTSDLTLDGDKPLQTRSTLQSLYALVEADAAWESAIGEAMGLLRRDEPSGSMQWQTPLRVALQSSLQAVTTHVDRVRQLFSPLTSQNELAQMSEMYAPPSPTNSHQSLAQQQSTSPTNLPKSNFNSRLDKRITWSGPTSKQLSRRSADVHGIFPRPGSPIPPVPRLPQAPSSPSDGSEDGAYGALALELQKNQTPPPRHSLMTPRSAGSLRVSPTAASRFTAMQSIRNPLAMYSLDAALQAALASKRFACAHLLALRFEEEEDDMYWEDVRSVMSLLSTSLEDETARLSEAMDEWHKSRQRDARPSATSTPSPVAAPETHLPPRRHRQLTSFAPQSSQMAKAKTHIDSIGGALDRAFGELETCVSSLHRHEADAVEAGSLEECAQAAMSAYESLRRELGLALRECERARSPILSILNDRNADATSEPNSSSNTPLEQDGAMPGMNQQEDPFPDSPTRAGTSSPPPAYVSRGPSQIVDDATAHLLAGATAMHLPPFGVDRVFEADSGPAFKPYTKERSRLSRAERIQLAQAKRKSMRLGTLPTDGERRAGQPVMLGGDVVEELKEVINRVNERKQRMATLPARRATQATYGSFSPSQNSAILETGMADTQEGALLVSELPYINQSS